MAKFEHKTIEKKWQQKWEADGLYSPNVVNAKNKFYNLWMFPYPSAEGLHAGHAFASTGSDAYGRFERMKGKTVFQPIGYDSFGIHSENYAIKIDQMPQEVVDRTTKHYEEQMRSLGHGYDWNRTVTTSSPDYYKWTQWLFIQMWEAGLAHKKKASVNFCPSCKTVLADEQVMTPKQAGKEPKDAQGNVVPVSPESEDLKVCERCGTVVAKRDLDQWFFKITDYADRLLNNLEKIDWSEKVKVAQKEWIGKKTGITINYQIKDHDAQISCFTTRPDTNFGATFIVCSPEYTRENILKIIDDDYKVKIAKYIEVSLNKTEQQRKEGGREKTGEFTGLYAINNLNGRELPVYVSDFVLSGFGTGAVVGVPGHDKRDFEFAAKFGLPIERVVVASDGDTSEIVDISQVQEEEGAMVNSEFLNGMHSSDAKHSIMDYLEEKNWGKRSTNYHLRDWIVSRQRYWGAPIPMVNCVKCGWVPVPERDLPVLLPEITDYKPKGDGKGPLASHKDFYEVSCPKCGGKATRETDVMDTFVDSSWYFLRYPSIDAKSSNVMPFDTEITKQWLPVDLYFGGAEHSVLHLMYARFVTMVLHDQGHLEFEEPFNKFFAHGLMIKDGAKMSKSRGNVVNPDEYIEKFGADTLRLYLMFMGPMDGYPDFRDSGIEGMQRFVNRVWSLYENTSISLSQEVATKVSIKTHKTIKKVSEEMENFRFNTAIASIMELVNEMKSASDVSDTGEQSAEWNFALKALCQLMAPFTPHLSEELWVEELGEGYSVHTSRWPSFDEALTIDETVKLPVQVNGKLRGVIEVASQDSENKDLCIKLALEDSVVAKWITSDIKKQVFIPGKLVNFVI